MRRGMAPTTAGASAGYAASFLLDRGADPKISNKGGWSPLYLAFLPILISTPVVLCASISIGLPMAAICAALRLKSALPFVISGMLVGFCIPLLFLLLTRAPAGYWVSVLGALGGGVTGHTWWAATREPKDR